MAAITVTASDVVAGSGQTDNFDTALNGEVMSAGHIVYRGADKKVYLSDNNDADLAKRAVTGFLTASASKIGQRPTFQTKGTITLGQSGSSLLTPGITYYLSSTPGKMCIESEVTTGMKKIAVGTAINDYQLSINIVNTGITMP